MIFYQPKDIIFDSSSNDSMGLFIVVSGLVAGRTFTAHASGAANPGAGTNVMYYGHGATLGLSDSLLQRAPAWASGRYQIVAEGRSVGKGEDCQAFDDRLKHVLSSTMTLRRLLFKSPGFASFCS
eukprot:scaffold183703_cov47-Prasinocladus_malaysianus.AAC.1